MIKRLISEERVLPYITLADIARRVNRSVATVSHVLNGNGRKGIRVSEATRERIRQVAEDLNYRPNYVARHLVKKDTLVIGLVIPDIMQMFFNKVTYFFSRELGKAGYNLLLAHSYEDPLVEKSEIETILSRRVDGIVVAPAQGRANISLFREIEGRGIPLVLMDRYFRGESFVSVTSGDVEGSYQLFKHIVKRGARKIAFICGDPDTSVTAERLAGYRKAMEESELAVEDDLIFQSGYFQEDGYKAVKKLLRNGRIKNIDAISGVNDSVALGILEALWEEGTDVPGSLLVSGYGNERFSRYLRVPLTTVSQSPEQIARHTFSVLINLIRGKEIHARAVKVPCTLMVRESTTGIEQP